MPRASLPRPLGRLALALAVCLPAACQPNRTPPAHAPGPSDEVNIGYSTQDRRDVTGSVASATGEEMLVDQRSGRVEEMLIGRFPGVDVTRLANGDYTIRIRGSRSLLGSNEPLVVIDGVPSALSPGNALAALTPQNVARIDVLKDAGATAAYGSRGANGVILVTTRRGRD